MYKGEQSMRKQSGFTLIELLIVLAILGILVGVVAMSVGNLTTTATTRAKDSELDIVQTAIDTYNTQDVTVELAAAIGARAAAAVITSADADAPFAKYLKRDTKYSFTWGAGGTALAIP
jgi:prepilin-type N-terminal cleavage/methylation domain-containing protein